MCACAHIQSRCEARRALTSPLAGRLPVVPDQGTPVLMYEDDCFYAFEWKSSAACATTGLSGGAIFMIVYVAQAFSLRVPPAPRISVRTERVPRDGPQARIVGRCVRGVWVPVPPLRGGRQGLEAVPQLRPVASRLQRALCTWSVRGSAFGPYQYP